MEQLHARTRRRASGVREGAAAGPSPAPSGRDVLTLMAGLQRDAGNQAVVSLLTGQHGGVQEAVVQRHASWEHALMGDSNPKDIGDAARKVASRQHVLDEEVRRARFFREDPYRDPRSVFKDVRWIALMGKLETRSLWISNGELNSLADYLPDPETIDQLPHSKVVPVLQRMREAIERSATSAMGQEPSGDYEGAVHGHWVTKHLSRAAEEVLSLDDATAGLGPERYKGLLSRNACHFAPFSWQRWRHFHNEARVHAKEHHRVTMYPEVGPNVDEFTEDHARKAILNNGYGDHFLQDSFAAGHLINKTLVMQWFVESLRDEIAEVFPDDPDWNVYERAIGVGEDIITAIPQMKGIAGRELYAKGGSSPRTAAEDRASGTEQTDPQSAEERTDRSRRISGAGVEAGGGRTREQNYSAYLQLLNATYVQMSGLAVHDWFNERGLRVANGRGDVVNVGGDSTMLSLSDRRGAEIPAEAAQLSRRAIDELLATGTTSISPEQIFDLFPVKVVAWPLPNGAWHIGDPRSLEAWHDEVLHEICRTVIFPEYVKSLTALGGQIGNTMVKGGVSRDS